MHIAIKTSQSWIFLLIFTFTILLHILKPTSASFFLHNSCPNTTMFAKNSQYETNLNKLFQYLSSNATNPTGFYQAVSHTNHHHHHHHHHNKSETIYGHFLCRGDLSPSDCQECVTTATTTDLPTTYCRNRKEAVIWYEECMVRYSNKSFFGKLNENPSLFMFNVKNVTGNVSRFEELVVNLLNNVVSVRAAGGGPTKKFSTDALKYNSSQMIYGMGQCTPDLSAKKCEKCLKNGVLQFKESQGGRALKASCIIRYELYPFFSLASLPPSPEMSPLAPQPSPLMEPPSPSPKMSVQAPQPSPIADSPPPELEVSPSGPPVSPLPQVSPPSQPSLSSPPEVSPPSSQPSVPSDPINSSAPSPSATTALSPHFNAIYEAGLFVALSLFYHNFLA